MASSAAHWSDLLARLGACSDAVDWARTQPRPEAAWAACGRADWLLWIAMRLAPAGSDAHRRVVLAACACARTAPPYAGGRRDEIDLHLGVVEAWTRGEADDAALRRARCALWCIYAAYAAARAVYAAASAADAYAAYAADAAADAALAASAAAARVAALREMADLVRSIVPPPIDALAAYGRAVVWTERRIGA